MEWEIILVKIVIILHSQQRINSVLTAFLIIHTIEPFVELACS
jgi:hypothetical protein